MFRYILLAVAILGFVNSAEISEKSLKRLAKKGKKVAEIFCNKQKLEGVKGDSLNAIKSQIEASKACENLSRKNLEALAYFLKAGAKTHTSKKLYKEVKKSHKCPVCGMFVYKYPKWSAKMVVAGKEYFFDGVKDMMKFYFFDGDFPFDRAKISQMRVSDFYTLESIDAKKAFYVVGSKVYGPMGNELIPFKDRASAEDFKREHSGREIVGFGEITPKMVMALDGIELK